MEREERDRDQVRTILLIFNVACWKHICVFSSFPHNVTRRSLFFSSGPSARLLPRRRRRGGTVGGQGRR